MRVAIVHDYIKEYGGAERVLESLHNVFPKAPVYTLVYLPSYLGPHRSRFENWDIRTSWAQNLPFKAKLISPLRLIAPYLFGQFDFSKFDVVIVSATGAYFPNSIKTRSTSSGREGNAIQICYSHTPPRYLYGYETARNWKKNLMIRIIGEIAIHFLRMVDYKSAQNVDYFIANSEETKRRIEKFYRKDAIIIYPPVDVNPKFKTLNPKQAQITKYKIPNTEYYLAGGRIARAKHTDLIINTFIRNGLPLKVFGKGFAGFEEEIKQRIKNHESRIKGKSNIEFLGEVTDEEKDELMMNAKAFVFASEDEDFGIVPVEAMMAGTPVIAHRSGGVLETVVEGKTGLFFDEFSVESLNSAIKKFERTKFDSSQIAKHAQKFSRPRFEKEIKEFVEKHA
ncbi:MAG: glycosyltransferase [Candidatus Levybacteria bacterium]|nr:glycosyltransferase [Candidatus Levybacteria bacterium]